MNKKLKEFEKYLSDKYKDYTTEPVEACPADQEHITEMVSKYYIEKYLERDKIINLYEYNRNYNAILPCRISQKKQQLTELNNDRLLYRARQYADGEVKEKLDHIIETITSVLDARIREAEKSDETEKEQVILSYRGYLKTTDLKLYDLYQNAKKREIEDSWIGRLSDAMSDFETMPNAIAINKFIQEHFGEHLSEEQKKELDKIALIDRYYGGQKMKIIKMAETILESALAEVGI